MQLWEPKKHLWCRGEKAAARRPDRGGKEPSSVHRGMGQSTAKENGKKCSLTNERGGSLIALKRKYLTRKKGNRPQTSVLGGEEGAPPLCFAGSNVYLLERQDLFARKGLGRKRHSAKTKESSYGRGCTSLLTGEKKRGIIQTFLPEITEDVSLIKEGEKGVRMQAGGGNTLRGKEGRFLQKKNRCTTREERKILPGRGEVLIILEKELFTCRRKSPLTLEREGRNRLL